MTVELAIKITSPLTADDRDLLSGVAVMVLAIANRELAQQRFSEVFASDEDENPDLPPDAVDYMSGRGNVAATEQPQPCGAVNPANESEVCISPVGHRGKHRFRKLGTTGLMNERRNP